LVRQNTDSLDAGSYVNSFARGLVKKLLTQAGSRPDDGLLTASSLFIRGKSFLIKVMSESSSFGISPEYHHPA
jgi:hypothetical protein